MSDDDRFVILCWRCSLTIATVSRSKLRVKLLLAGKGMPSDQEKVKYAGAVDLLCASCSQTLYGFRYDGN